ncbi:hypothetical protein DRE_04074 [Drechslerella stenobrocha 248]|uniref:D-aminoacyl-tRNA deacylase n=1 Tax=Drechslerella stenobrocha 248 TaxID=1043628 RepID=W7I2I0_9PEZI|nr:hypothetical protein DRE_04074 [Drechslerella stenobrocha 248]
MRFWDDEDGGKWRKSVIDIEGEVLCVSQFTLLANTRKGRKPDFHGAMAPDKAKALYEAFFAGVQQGYKPEKVKDGVFQAMMQVALVNDGPVTLELNTPEKKPKPEKGNKVAKLKVGGTETPGSTSGVSEEM